MRQIIKLFVTVFVVLSSSAKVFCVDESLQFMPEERQANSRKLITKNFDGNYGINDLYEGKNFSEKFKTKIRKWSFSNIFRAGSLKKYTDGYTGGIGLGGLLLILFVTLKLTNVISWPWFWVLSPLWIMLSLFLFVALIIAIIYVQAT